MGTQRQQNQRRAVILKTKLDSPLVTRVSADKIANQLGVTVLSTLFEDTQMVAGSALWEDCIMRNTCPRPGVTNPVAYSFPASLAFLRIISLCMEPL